MEHLRGHLTAVAGHDTGSLIIQLNVLARTVAEQPAFPVIDIAGLKELNAHLRTAQGHANDWLNGLSGDLWNRLQGLVTFGETFNHLYQPLLAAAQNMGDEDAFQPNEIHKLIGALQALQTLVKGQLVQSQQSYSALAAYRTNVAADHSAFLTDYNTANVALGGTTGEIAELEKKIDSEQEALNKDLAMIAGGSTMMVVGGLMIAVGALAEIETAGVSTALIAGGVAVIAGGATMTGIAGKNYDDTLKNMRDDKKRLAEDKAELTLLNHAKGQLGGLNDTLDQASAALQNLVTSWQQLDNGISAVVDDLQSPQDFLASIRKDDPDATPATASMIVVAELQTANDDWTQAVGIAKALLAKGRTVQYISTGGAAPTQDAIAKGADAAAPLKRAA